jgi:hypothetical protein
MNHVELTYYTKNSENKYEHHTVSGELVVGNAMFSDMVGVRNNHEGIILFPASTLVRLQAKELDDMFLVKFGLLQEVINHQDTEMSNKINNGGGNHLFG